MARRSGDSFTFGLWFAVPYRLADSWSLAPCEGLCPYKNHCMRSVYALQVIRADFPRFLQDDPMGLHATPSSGDCTPTHSTCQSSTVTVTRAPNTNPATFGTSTVNKFVSMSAP